MRRTSLILASVFAAAVLTACGGGGGGTTSPVPQPSQAPQTLSVRISWSGVGHSSGTHASSLALLDSVSSEPVEESIKPPCQIGAQGCNSVNANSNFSNATAQVQVVDANGNPVPEPSPSVSLAAPNATVSPAPQPSPTANAPAQYNVSASVSNPASTTMTAQYSPTLTGSLPVRQFAFMALEWPAVHDKDAAGAYTLQNGFLISQVGTTGGDLYIAKDTDGIVKVFAPGGIQILGAAQPIGTLTSALPFAPSGTAVALSALTANPVIVAKSANGYVALKFGTVACSYNTTANTCDASGMAGAIYNSAGTDGAFH